MRTPVARAPVPAASEPVIEPTAASPDPSVEVRILPIAPPKAPPRIPVITPVPSLFLEFESQYDLITTSFELDGAAQLIPLC